MKKIIAMILACLMVVSLAACKNEVKEEDKKVDDAIVDVENKEELNEEKEEIKEEASDKKEEVKEETKKPQAESKPQAEETKKPIEETKKPIEETKPQEETKSTLGNALLKDFKSKASSMNVLSLAEALIANPEIKFMGGAMQVEEGYLSGFDNVEIKGFKEGATFMPMIGSIAFVGYVFELENASDVPAFIANLEKNANKRWNVCVEADEMDTGSVGNKVLFVMCPEALEE